MSRTEQYPGGPAVDIAPVRPARATEACCLCGAACADDFVLDGRRTPAYRFLCPTCFWRYPYNVNPDVVPPGCELGGTGI